MSKEFIPYFMQSVIDRGKAGDGDACFDVAEYYYAQKDFAQAFRWYKKTVECGDPNPNAYFNLGYAYQYGEGTEKDMFAAFEAYQKAAEQNLPQAMNNLAFFYESGIVVPKDQDKADELCRRATQVLNNLQTELFKTKRAYGELANQNTDLKKRMEEERAAATKAIEQAKTALGDAKVLQDKLAAATQEMQKLQRRHEEAAGQLSDAKKQAEAAAQVQAQLKLENARMQKNLQQSEQDKKNLQHDFTRTKEQLAAVKKDMVNAAQTEADLRQALLHKNRQVQALEETGRQLEKKNAAQNQAVQNKNKEIETLKEQVSESQNQAVDTQLESEKVRKKWKGRLALTVVLLGLVIVFLIGSLAAANDNYDSENRKYNKLLDKYSALQDDYEDVLSDLERYQTLVENNELDKLYRIQLNEVFNADKNGKKIDEFLKLDTLDCLRFRISITSPKKTGKWEDLIPIDLIRPDGTVIEGEEGHTWILDPTKHDDTKESVGWWMYEQRENITEAGTYQYVVYHNGYIVFRQEITIE